LSIIDSLITNRTGGFYNISDLNRVEEAFEYLRDKMNNSYGFNLAIPTKTNWTNTDDVIHSDMERYRQNVAKIRDAIAMPVGTPQTPASMNKLTAKEANDIEKILQAVEVLLDNISAAWFYSGEIYSGEVF
jgi:hypothetical protein